MQNGPRPWIVVVCVALLLIASCSTKTVEPPTPAALVSLSVAPVNSSIAPGTTVQFTATGTFSDNSKRNVTASVTWDSSDSGIATISNTGLATATMNIGPTVISAISDGITGTTTLSTSHVNLIMVTPTSPPCIAPGTTQQFAATGTLVDSTVQNLTSFATWTSSDMGIADVNDALGSKGLATAGATIGTATIEAIYDGVTGTATLTSSHVSSIAVAPASTSIPKGITQQFTATGTLSGGCANTQDLTTTALWSSSSTTVAAISNKGLATAVNVGSTDISATFDLVTSSTATITVTQPVLQSITVTPANQSIALGQTQLFTAIGTFSDNTTLDITTSVIWNSSVTGIATISNTSGTKGLATSFSEGTTTITASFSGIASNAATLTVTPAKLVLITVSPASADISIASTTTKQFTATGTFTDGSKQDVTTSVAWNSSDANVATISNALGFQGLATVSLIAPLPASTIITAALSGITSNTAILTVTF